MHCDIAPHEFHASKTDKTGTCMIAKCGTVATSEEFSPFGTILEALYPRNASQNSVPPRLLRLAGVAFGDLTISPCFNHGGSLCTDVDSKMLNSILSFYVRTPPARQEPPPSRLWMCGKQFSRFTVTYSSIGILRSPTKDSTNKYMLVQT